MGTHTRYGNSEKASSFVFFLLRRPEQRFCVATRQVTAIISDLDVTRGIGVRTRVEVFVNVETGLKAGVEATFNSSILHYFNVYRYCFNTVSTWFVPPEGRKEGSNPVYTTEKRRADDLAARSLPAQFPRNCSGRGERGSGETEPH